jgi:hypothetical protein
MGNVVYLAEYRQPPAIVHPAPVVHPFFIGTLFLISAFFFCWARSLQ